MTNTFRHVTYYGETRLTDNLGYGTSQFINQCYLNIGAFTNVTIPTSGAYGGNFHRLYPVETPYYNDGQVWEASRSHWVFENDLNNYDPIRVSGVYIDGVFNPTTGIANEHYINYRDGQIVFTSGIDINSTVECEYSFKNVQIFTDDCPWFKDVMSNSLRVDLSDHLTRASGDYATLSQNRVQLPAIIIQPLTNVSLVGRELGGYNKRFQDMLLHIIGEHPWQKTSIVDDLINQKNATYYIYDRDKALSSGVFPLDYKGALNTGGLMYNDIINNYYYRSTYISDVSANDFSKPGGLEYGIVRWKVEINI